MCNYSCAPPMAPGLILRGKETWRPGWGVRGRGEEGDPLLCRGCTQAGLSSQLHFPLAFVCQKAAVFAGDPRGRTPTASLYGF